MKREPFSKPQQTNMANDCRRAKDLQSLCRHVEKDTQGQARVVDVDDNMKFVLLNITPNQGLYRGANISFKISFSDLYPHRAPEVICLDHIYHPNIDTSEDVEFDPFDCTNVCVSLLDEWTDQMDLSHIVLAILFLMHHPAFDDCLSPYFDGSDAHTPMEEMEENIRRSLRGGTVDGWIFKRVLFDDVDEEKGSPNSDGIAGLGTTEGNAPDLPTDNGSGSMSCSVTANSDANPEFADFSCTDSDAHFNRVTAVAVAVLETPVDVESANEEAGNDNSQHVPVKLGIPEKGLVIDTTKSSLAEISSLHVGSVCDKNTFLLTRVSALNAQDAVEAPHRDGKSTLGLFRETKRNLNNVFGMFANLWKGSSAVGCDDEEKTDFELEWGPKLPK